MPTNLEYAQITLDTYKMDGENSAREGFGRFEKIDEGQDLPNGLSIQAYVDHNTNEVIIGTTGTNDINDTEAFPAFVAGGYPDQFSDALKYALDIKNQYQKDDNGNGYSFSVTGHSLGGGISQMLAHTFGWDGATFDAPAASGIIESDEYLAHVKSLGISPPTSPSELVNFTEQGSLVSAVPGRDYVGSETDLNIVGDGKQVLQRASLFAGLPGVVSSAASFVHDQWLSDNAQHSASKYPDYFSTPQDTSKIDGYQYVGGSYDGWYSTPPNPAIGQFDWAGRASSDKTAELNLQRDQRHEHNADIKQTLLNSSEQEPERSGPPKHHVSAEFNKPTEAAESVMNQDNEVNDKEADLAFSIPSP